MSVVRSAGTLTAIEAPLVPSVGPAGSLALYENVFADYAAIYATQPNIRTIISFLARNIAQLGLPVFRRVSDTDRQRLSDHPLARLIATPNPWTTRYRLIYALVSDRCIYDAALWVKFRNIVDPSRIALVRIPPVRITSVEGSWIEPTGFTITGNRGSITVPRESCVYFHGYHPGDNNTGISSMETLRRTIAEEHSAGAYRENFWRNSARMEHVITRPKDAPKMSPDAKDRFWARWNAQYTGTPNSAKTALLEEGMDIKQMSFSASDAQYIEGRKFNLEEAARFFHVPLQMVGILDNANFSNMREAHKQLYQDTLGPDLVDVEEEIVLQLVPEFDGIAGVDNTHVYVEFNIAEKLKGSFEEQTRSLQTAVGRPYMTANEGRARLNLPTIDGGDQLVTPLNVLIGGQASPTDTAPPPKTLPRSGAKAVAFMNRPPAEELPGWVALHVQQLGDYFSDLGDAVVAALPEAKAATKDVDPADLVDVEEWNDRLADLLLPLAVGVSSETGETTAAGFAGTYDVDRTLAYLTSNAETAARNINLTALDQLRDAIARAEGASAILEAFADMTPSARAQLAAARVNWAGNFGIHEGAAQSGVRRKTWTVTSSNPRPSHSAAAGQTVAMDQVFTVGGRQGRWPHDHTLGVDEIAGCTCILSFHLEG